MAYGDDAGSGRQYSIFALKIGGTEYQVVTRFLRGAADGDSPTAVLGFLVNMDWAREHYFIPMVESVISGTGVPPETQVDPAGVEFALSDGSGDLTLYEVTVPAGPFARSGTRSAHTA